VRSNWPRRLRADCYDVHPMMTDLTYAVADLHGRFDLLDAALGAIERHAPPGGRRTVVFLGDYVDRGPGSRQILDRLMTGPSPGWRWICLKGNHEDIMWQSCRTLPHCGWWLQNGGGQTLISYGQKPGDRADVKVVPDSHLDWIAALPLMHVDRHRVFVHAGVHPNFPLDEQDPERLIWKLYHAGDPRGHGDRHVVHGHEQFEDGPIRLSGRTDLDTFAWYTGRLVVGVFDDAVPDGPTDLIEVRRP
jgi:serine/threonine protein phosphatase 1